jgi:hypothetical protein
VSGADDLTIRRATAEDVGAVLVLLRDAMHRSDDDRFDALFRWKHLENAFGPSPAWVAVDGDRVVAVRYLMRWEFEQDGARRRAVRAVDTATHPDFQGRGLFRRLTLGAVDELAGDVEFVFNTPNDQSRPGYLKMGWQLVGTLPVSARPLRASGIRALARARVPAEHFSLDTDVAEPAARVLDDTRAVERVLAATRPAAPGLRTWLTPAVLRWRYGGDLLRYRAVTDPDGLALFRLRRRGPAVEAALGLVLAPSATARRRLSRAVLHATRGQADYAVAIGARPEPTFAPVPRTGPTLTWRVVGADPTTAAAPPRADWHLTLGDIELF